MEINEVEIRRIVSVYRQSDDSKRQEALDAFRREVELYVYNFPRLAYRKDPDVCSDFYIYALDRLESVIRNFPEGEPVKFKTWLNYVLRNQFLNYLRSVVRDDALILAPEEFEERLAGEFSPTEADDFRDLRDGLDKIPALDKDLIKFYYMPETMEPDEIRRIAESFGTAISDALKIRGEIIGAHEREVLRLRETAAELGGLERKLTYLKHKLYIGKEEVAGDHNDMLAKVARLEGRKMKLIRELQTPEHEAFRSFAKLFQNVNKARYRLNISRQKLKFEILKIMRSRKRP